MSTPSEPERSGEHAWYDDIFMPPWTLLWLIALCGAVFVWTNWFFSPSKRVERLGELMAHTHSTETLQADDDLRRSPLRVVTGAMGDNATYCRQQECEIELLRLYSLETGGYISITVTVGLTPVLSELSRTSWLPAEVDWKANRWQWSVTVHPDRDRSGRTKSNVYAGELHELDPMSGRIGTPTVANYIRSVAKDMASTLERQNSP